MEFPAAAPLSTPVLLQVLLKVLLLQVLPLAAAAWALVFCWQRCARFRRIELAIPGPAWTLPVLGNALHLARINEDNILDVIMDLWGGRHSELSRLSMFNMLFVLVSDPDHIAKVVRERRFVDKAWIFYGPLREVLGEGLLTADSALWRSHRQLLQPTFHQGILERYAEVFAEEATSFLERLRPLEGRDVEFVEEMHRFASDSVLRTTLAATYEEEDKEDIQFIVSSMKEAIVAVNYRSLRPWLWPGAIFNLTSMGRKQTLINERGSETIGRVVRRKTKDILERIRAPDFDQHRKLGFKERKTFLDLMLEANLAAKSNFSNQEIEDEVRTIFCTAVETSVATLAFVFKILSIRSDIQDRVHQEVLDVLGDRLATSDDLHRLEYTERVIKETLRIFPTVPLIARHVQDDTELCGKMIPAGSTLLINVLGAHRDPRHHPEPLHFDPDRFLPERTGQWHPHAYLPFSAGPRNCIGKQYAMMQMKSILCTTLRAYRLEPAKDGITHPSQFPLTFDIVLRFVGGTKVRFEPRIRSS